MTKEQKTIKVGQKLTAPFSLEIFDSRNTSYNTNPYRNTPLGEMRLMAKKASMPFKAVIHDSTGHWVEYEKGEITSWSVTQD